MPTPGAAFPGELVKGGDAVGKNKQNGGHQQGAIHHEPGQHGDKTRARQAEIAHTSHKRSDEAHEGGNRDELSERNRASSSKRKT